MNTIREMYLKRLNDNFKEMSDLVIEQLGLVHRQLCGENDLAIFDKIEENERKMDQMEVCLRDDIINSIVLYSPRASDLRQIISSYDTIIDLERMGDVIHGISKKMHYLLKEKSIYPIYQEDVINLFLLADHSAQNAIFAFLCENSELAKNIIVSDETLDEQYRAAHKKLFDQKEDEKYPFLIADLLDLGRILYGMERIGDGATNIAEAVIFITEGIDVKHSHEKRQ